jgi:hypothetical protein
MKPHHLDKHSPSGSSQCSRACLTITLLMEAAALSCSWYGLLWLQPLIRQRTTSLKLQLQSAVVLEPCAESSRPMFEKLSK